MDQLDELAERLEKLVASARACDAHARTEGAEVMDEGALVPVSLHPALATRIDGPAGETLDAWSNTLVTSVMRILWTDPSAWSDEGMAERAARAKAIRSKRIDLTEPTVDLTSELAARRPVAPPPVPETSGPRRHRPHQVA